MKKLCMTFLFAIGVGASMTAPAGTCYYACSIDQRHCMDAAGSDPAEQSACYAEFSACKQACTDDDVIYGGPY
jgi:hypothetical protein